MVGVPVNSPVDELNVAQEGLFVIEKVNFVESISVTEGVNVYSMFSVECVVGIPEIIGGSF